MKRIMFGIIAVVFALTVTAKEKETKTGNDSENTATVALSGTVYDSDSGELLVGVEVKIDGTDTKTYTDFDGNFSFENIKPGEYKLVANYISYKKSAETLHVDASKNQVNIKLENSN
ncbi:carboxypeptidase-like regulatory domain-containing protein [Mariniphaga sediminis]|uniref:carboxypeptidase-like regulatory domain-containing protein n=1 Tax=Mariniphaga sediminis TaxID=1628158 RepID=UPI00356B31F0